MDCQYQERHPLTGAAAGGWAWPNLSGGWPDADDTAAALIALATRYRSCPEDNLAEIKRAARLGMHWLLELQNKDGGWPTFCRGWGRLPFDRSSCDISAHVLHALHDWRDLLNIDTTNVQFASRLEVAQKLGLKFLGAKQQADGSWNPLWFGNQHHPDEINPVYGTAKVLLMCDALRLDKEKMTQRGLRWMVSAQRADGGWSAVPADAPPLAPSPQERYAPPCSAAFALASRV